METRRVSFSSLGAHASKTLALAKALGLPRPFQKMNANFRPSGLSSVTLNFAMLLDHALKPQAFWGCLAFDLLFVFVVKDES
jgi:hypothetical protein